MPAVVLCACFAFLSCVNRALAACKAWQLGPDARNRLFKRL